MILIDKPYISDFLFKTIKENNLQIIGTSTVKEMMPDNSLNWISENEAKRKFENNPNSPLLTNSENTVSWVEKNLYFTKLPSQIHFFKNKIKFRELLADIYPGYFFKGLKYDELKLLEPDKLKYPLIIKPAVGFFSLGVHKIDSQDEWPLVLNQIEREVNLIQSNYPKEVVNATDYILEECINGEEYAIDCYFNQNGDPVILNILHHIFSSKNDVSDRIYSTSAEIIKSLELKVRNFLKIIGKKTGLINFPAHVEIRVDETGNIFPIEVNPLRFGGWCTTADLTWVAYGFNSYQYFLKAQTPDWDEIFRTKMGKKYSIVVLDNNSGYAENEIEDFDYDLLVSDFENPMELRKIDSRKHGFFGFLFTETTAGNEEELNRILTSNLRKYINLKEGIQ